MKTIAIIVALLMILPKANAQMAVAVASNTDPTFLAMASKSIATNGQMIAQLADSVQNISTTYQMVNANNNITSQFAAFANMFGVISGFMNDYVCSGCSPDQLNQWDKLKASLTNIDGDLCHNIANILSNGGKISGNIASLAQDITQIMNTNMSAMTPAQTATTQARLLGSLGTGVQQTNTLLHSAMQMQTAQVAKENMQAKNAQLTQEASFTNMKNTVKP